MREGAGLAGQQGQATTSHVLKSSASSMSWKTAVLLVETLQKPTCAPGEFVQSSSFNVLASKHLFRHSQRSLPGSRSGRLGVCRTVRELRKEGRGPAPEELPGTDAIESHKGLQLHVHAHKQTDSQTDRQQTDRQTDR